MWSKVEGHPLKSYRIKQWTRCREELWGVSCCEFEVRVVMCDVIDLGSVMMWRVMSYVVMWDVRCNGWWSLSSNYSTPSSFQQYLLRPHDFRKSNKPRRTWALIFWSHTCRLLEIASSANSRLTTLIKSPRRAVGEGKVQNLQIISVSTERDSNNSYLRIKYLKYSELLFLDELDAARELLSVKETKRGSTMKMLLVTPKKRNKGEMKRLLNLIPSKRWLPQLSLWSFDIRLILL